MPNFIRERSMGQVIRDSVRIYRENFGTIFALYFFNAFFWTFISNVLDKMGKAQKWVWIFWVLGKLVSFVAGVQITAFVTQVYLGYELNLKRVFSRPDMLPKALATGFLVLVLFFAYPLFMFTVTVVVVEGVWGFRALKRSVDLGSHYYVRNFVVFVWPYTVYFMLWTVYLVLSFMLTPSNGWSITITAIKLSLFTLITPLAIIMTVVLYFDMRIRNEAYDIVALAEELRR